MKTILSLLFALTLGTAFGQSIPQPMGYNPDVNGDEFIGVDDVMGTLALYDNAFDNGDSIVTLSINFPDDYDEWLINGNGANVEIPDSLDIIYLHQEEDTEVRFYLPQGTGYKDLQFFCSCYPVAAYEITITFSGPGTLLQESLRCQKPTYFRFLRGENGVWYRTRID